jgi:hypothetical protein
MKVKYHKIHKMKMQDKNGKRIYEKSFVKYATGWGAIGSSFNAAQISRIEETTFQIKFSFNGGRWNKNPYEVEVITKGEAVLLMFER